jgi:hypothetical protein
MALFGLDGRDPVGKNDLLWLHSVEETRCSALIQQAGHRFFSEVLDSGH